MGRNLKNISQLFSEKTSLLPYISAKNTLCFNKYIVKLNRKLSIELTEDFVNTLNLI